MTVPANGWSIATMASRPPKIKIDSAPDISDLRAQIGRAEKEGEAEGNEGADKEYRQMMPGTMPLATTNRSRRASLI